MTIWLYGIRTLPESGIKDRINGLLNKMNIRELSQRYPRQLSGASSKE